MNKTALITGGARGIGLGISKKLASIGMNLAICGVRTEEDVEDTLCELRKFNTNVIYYQCDISKANDRHKMLYNITKDFETLDILVNNAGVAPKVRSDILDATEESYERVMKINLQGPYFLTQNVARIMISQKEKYPETFFSIINISSISATTASPSRGEYCISKAGIAMASKLWAVRLGEFNIPVYEIRPGIIQTDMTSSVKEKYDKLIDEGLLLQARWGLPEDVAKTVASITRGDIAYSTGQVIMVDGGFSIDRL